jgi:hypothetical protein
MGDIPIRIQSLENFIKKLRRANLYTLNKSDLLNA